MQPSDTYSIHILQPFWLIVFRNDVELKPIIVYSKKSEIIFDFDSSKITTFFSYAISISVALNQVDRQLL